MAAAVQVLTGMAKPFGDGGSGGGSGSGSSSGGRSFGSDDHHGSSSCWVGLEPVSRGSYLTYCRRLRQRVATVLLASKDDLLDIEVTRLRVGLTVNQVTFACYEGPLATGALFAAGPGPARRKGIGLSILTRNHTSPRCHYT
mmetsp:Transcript_32221/g.54331  ORF Transcript_32221/g.54331 Transcript_32221/m.54331 type:complete len:142 (-) Transcript_32221:147-572(-)